MIDWGDLRYLHVIARAGSLAAAARELGVEHSTVGRRLTALEAALGARMFTRGPEGLVPTRACEDIAPLLDAMATQAEAVERRARGEDKRVEGKVRLTVPHPAASFTPILASLRERHPSLVVEVVADNRTLDLLRGEADVAIRFTPVTEPDLVARKVIHAGWKLYASPAYLKRRAFGGELRGHDVIGYEAKFAWPGAVWLERHQKGASVVLHANDLSTAQEATAAGMGITMLPCMHGDADARITRAVADPIGKTDIFLVMHKDLAGAARVRAVVDAVVELFDSDRSIWTGER